MFIHMDGVPVFYRGKTPYNFINDKKVYAHVCFEISYELEQVFVTKTSPPPLQTPSYIYEKHLTLYGTYMLIFKSRLPKHSSINFW